jgi:hypothetical protein
MNAILGANQAGHSQDSGGLLIPRARTELPAFSSRVGMRMKGRHDNGARNEHRRCEVKRRPSPCGRTPNRYGSCRRIHVNPPTFFMPVGRVGRLRIQPGLFEGLLYLDFIQEFAGPVRP